MEQLSPCEHLAEIVVDYRLAINAATAALYAGRYDDALAYLKGVASLGGNERRPVSTGIEVTCDRCGGLLRTGFASEDEAEAWETENGSLCLLCVASSTGRASV